MEKRPKKKVRKFVSIEKEDKELQLAFENETSDSGKNDIKKKHLKMISSKKRVSKKSTTSWLHQSDSITISEEHRGQVELGTIEYFHSENMNAVFAENHLWRGIFGLVFWDIVFDPALVSFHHPFQRRPSEAT